MSEKIKDQDFIELDYTGQLADGKVFDTTHEEIAKKNNLFSPQMNYKPLIVCVGEQQLVPGLDQALIDKEIGQEYKIDLKPEQAFGKKDVKKIKLVPISEFQKQNIQPHPGLQIDMDGEVGTVLRASGGRILVNFNHPFAGREITYQIKINKKVTDKDVQISSFLELSLNLTNIKTEIKEDKAIITLPAELPEPLQQLLSDKLKEITNLKEITFQAEQKQTTPKQ